MFEVWRDGPLRPASCVGRSDAALNIGRFGIFLVHPVSRPLRRSDYAIFRGIVRLYNRTEPVAVPVTNVSNNYVAPVNGFGEH